MALKIKLIKAYASAPDTQIRTLEGLGLWRFGQERVLQDTKAIRGMVFKVKHLVTLEEVPGDAPKRKRSKPRHVKAREAARAKAE
jgi:large subunit ribosomal protein L30